MIPVFSTVPFITFRPSVRRSLSLQQREYSNEAPIHSFPYFHLPIIRSLELAQARMHRGSVVAGRRKKTYICVWNPGNENAKRKEMYQNERDRREKERDMLPLAFFLPREKNPCSISSSIRHAVLGTSSSSTPGTSTPLPLLNSPCPVLTGSGRETPETPLSPSCGSWS